MPRDAPQKVEKYGPGFDDFRKFCFLFVNILQSLLDLGEISRRDRFPVIELEILHTIAQVLPIFVNF
jgi:hypothetical protein